MVYLLLVDEEYVLYVGNMPTTDSHIAILPDKLQHFYKHLHNGWFENISGGLGLLPIEKGSFPKPIGMGFAPRDIAIYRLKQNLLCASQWWKWISLHQYRG